MKKVICRGKEEKREEEEERERKGRGRKRKKRRRRNWCVEDQRIKHVQLGTAGEISEWLSFLLHLLLVFFAWFEFLKQKLSF